MLWKPILVAVVALLVGVEAARAGADEPPSLVAETLADTNSDGVPDGWQLHPVLRTSELGARTTSEQTWALDRAPSPSKLLPPRG